MDWIWCLECRHFVAFWLLNPLGRLFDAMWYQAGKFSLTFSGTTNVSRLMLYLLATESILLRSAGRSYFPLVAACQDCVNILVVSVLLMPLLFAIQFSISMLAINAHVSLSLDKNVFSHIRSIALFRV